jgi:23S rRNA pseudouridine2604 synthase
MAEAIRLAKRLAQELGCSRRQAEQYIEGAWVSVDGTTVEDPACRVQPSQAVQLSSHAVAEDVPPVTILLHLPADMAQQSSINDATALLPLLDVQSRMDNGGMRQLRKHFRGLKLVAGLEGGASGLVVLTQDRRVERRLTEDIRQIEQEYIVDLEQEIQTSLLTTLEREAARRNVVAKISRQSEMRLRFALKANGMAIVDICAEAGLAPLTLRRIRIGRIALAGLGPGQWRYLRDAERF